MERDKLYEIFGVTIILLWELQKPSSIRTFIYTLDVATRFLP
jgi:hypothetical protein